MKTLNFIIANYHFSISKFGYYIYKIV